MPRLQLHGEASAAGKLFIGWISVELPLPSHNYRGVGWRNAQLPEQNLCLRIGLQVHETVGYGIALGKVAEPVRILGKAGADDLDALEPGAVHQLAPEQEGLDDDVPQIGQLIDRSAQVPGAQLHQPAILDRAAGNQGGASVEHVDVAGELPGV